MHQVLMFVTVSSEVANLPESLCSLNFAARCRSVALGRAKRNTGSNNSVTKSSVRRVQVFGGRVRVRAVRKCKPSLPAADRVCRQRSTVRCVSMSTAGVRIERCSASLA